MNLPVWKLRPDVTPWRNGQTLKTGRGQWGDIHRWRTEDELSATRGQLRRVFHYRTWMGTYLLDSNTFEVESVGHGSASDQQGMNTLLTPFPKIIGKNWQERQTRTFFDWGLSYARNGGNLRYEATK